MSNSIKKEDSKYITPQKTRPINTVMTIETPNNETRDKNSISNAEIVLEDFDDTNINRGTTHASKTMS
jgi:hypothetical protein